MPPCPPAQAIRISHFSVPRPINLHRFPLWATVLNRKVKSVVSDFYRVAIDELVQARLSLSWTQSDLAKKWDRNQSVIAKIETLERRLDLIEFVDLCILLGLDPAATIARIHEMMKSQRLQDDLIE